MLTAYFQHYAGMLNRVSLAVYIAVKIFLESNESMFYSRTLSLLPSRVSCRVMRPTNTIGDKRCAIIMVINFKGWSQMKPVRDNAVSILSVVYLFLSPLQCSFSIAVK